MFSCPGQFVQCPKGGDVGATGFTLIMLHGNLCPLPAKRPMRHEVYLVDRAFQVRSAPPDHELPSIPMEKSSPCVGPP